MKILKKISLIIGISSSLSVLSACQPRPDAPVQTAIEKTAPESAQIADKAASASGVHHFMLDNGMKILVLPDHRSPVVVSQVWYKVGGSYEYAGVTGVSHALEHMMFKGTRRLKPGEFSEIIAANGGSENAFTGKDYTAYFQRIASDRLELCLENEADRMRNLQLSDEEFKKEIEVIKEERRSRTDDSPTSFTYERFNAAAFINSSYQQPIIGWMEDLDSMQLEDLSAWYKTWYAPNNATLVVAGDIDPQQVLQWAEKYFGPLEPSHIESLKPRREVEQKGERRIIVKVPAKVPYLLMGYKAPVLKTAKDEWEVYALEVLAGVLDGGNSSRLSQQLVRKSEIASSAGAGYDLYARQEALFLFNGVPRDGHTPRELEMAIKKQIKDIQNRPPSEKELSRVKAQVMAASVYEKDSVFYQAMQMGTLETVGLGWQKKDDYLKKVQQVTAEQVQAVAKKYLIDDSLTVAILDPQPVDPAASRKPVSVSGARHGR
ncbi:FIG015547: peptidase, M16 family [hydrothermal vent metagenome]|uniref:FIG015547: peptidase, M16 family n=1 Tax=hydrothermal vent metagenome TaxID=652676 RepID=A0A3B0XH25_9ZZZZ